MTTVKMEHHSRPGYYKCELSQPLRDALTAIASLMIPAEGDLPAAGEIVSKFVEQRVSPAELSTLERVVGAMEGLDVAALTRLEEHAPDDFAALRSWTYLGYYGSPVVAGLLELSGSRYHGAPQPLGYELTGDAPVPSSARGSFVPTEEVRRVSL